MKERKPPERHHGAAELHGVCGHQWGAHQPGRGEDAGHLAVVEKAIVQECI